MPAVAVGTPSLLILELDADRLRAEGHLDGVDAFLASLAEHRRDGSLRIRRLSIRSAAEFTMVARSAAFGFMKYDAIVLVAHASPGSVAAAPGLSHPWEDMATVLAPLGAKALLAIACFGGSGAACRPLFDGMPTLDVVLGSPTTLTARHAQLAMTELVCTACGSEWSPEASTLSTVLNAMFTQGVVVRRTRAEVDGSTELELLIKDVAGVTFGAIVQEVFTTPPPRRRRRRPHRRRL